MVSSSAEKEHDAAHEQTMRGGRRLRPSPGSLKVIDHLTDSFALLSGESQWLVALMADDLARILADD